MLDLLHALLEELHAKLRFTLVTAARIEPGRSAEDDHDEAAGDPLADATHWLHVALELGHVGLETSDDLREIIELRSAGLHVQKRLELLLEFAPAGLDVAQPATLSLLRFGELEGHRGDEVVRVGIVPAQLGRELKLGFARAAPALSTLRREQRARPRNVLVRQLFRRR